MQAVAVEGLEFDLGARPVDGAGVAESERRDEEELRDLASGDGLAQAWCTEGGAARSDAHRTDQVEGTLRAEAAAVSARLGPSQAVGNHREARLLTNPNCTEVNARSARIVARVKAGIPAGNPAFPLSLPLHPWLEGRRRW